MAPILRVIHLMALILGFISACSPAARTSALMRAVRHLRATSEGRQQKSCRVVSLGHLKTL